MGSGRSLAQSSPPEPRWPVIGSSTSEFAMQSSFPTTSATCLGTSVHHKYKRPSFISGRLNCLQQRGCSSLDDSFSKSAQFIGFTFSHPKNLLRLKETKFKSSALGIFQRNVNLISSLLLFTRTGVCHV